MGGYPCPPAGHDKFPLDLARKVIGERDDFFGLEGVLYEGNILNMTYLALKLSRYINGSFFNTQRMLQEYVLNAYFNR